MGPFIAFMLVMFLGMVVIAVRLRGMTRTLTILLNHFVPLVAPVMFFVSLFTKPENPEKPWALDQIGGYWLFVIITYYAFISTVALMFGGGAGPSEAAQNGFIAWIFLALFIVLVSGCVLLRPLFTKK